MSDTVKATVDLTDFNRAFKNYLLETSKSIQQATNNKLFDIARFALKNTDKASKTDIVSSLKATSNEYPNRTVAEMIVVTNARRQGVSVTDIDGEAESLIKSRVKTIAFAKSGWIPAMKELMPYIQFKRATNDSIQGGRPKGGAEPVKTASNVMRGAVWNDVAGNPPSQFVESIKQHGAQEAVDKVTADMEQYYERKMEQAAHRFNKE